MKQKITICFPAPLGRESKYISTRVECQCQSSDFMHGIIPLHFRLPSLLVWLKRHKCSRRPGGGFFQTLAVVAAATAKEARRSQCRNFPKLILPSPLLSSPLLSARSLSLSPLSSFLPRRLLNREFKESSRARSGAICSQPVN